MTSISQLPLSHCDFTVLATLFQMYSFYKGTNPTDEGSTLIIQSPLKIPPPTLNSITLGTRFQRIHWGEAQH
jgi:hypothetical protein